MNTVGAPKTILAMTAEKKPSKEYYLEMVSKFESEKSNAMVIHGCMRKAHGLFRGEPYCSSDDFREIVGGAVRRSR